MQYKKNRTQVTGSDIANYVLTVFIKLFSQENFHFLRLQKL